MEFLGDILFSSFKIALIGIGIPLVSIFLLGLGCAFFQALTQIQDQVLSFFPKVSLCFFIIFFGSATFLNLITKLIEESLMMIPLVK